MAYCTKAEARAAARRAKRNRIANLLWRCSSRLGCCTSPARTPSARNGCRGGGSFDGHKADQVKILPTLAKAGQMFKGQEYLALYPAPKKDSTA